MVQTTTRAAPTKGRAREYETIYILRPNVDPDDAEKVSSRIGEVVDRLEGKLTKVDNWGKRKLAYPIDTHNRGIFVYLKYVGYSDLVHELERNLRLLDDVIRYQTVKLQDSVDLSSLEVDPEEVKFLRIEPTEDEEEPGIEQQLGFTSPEGEDKEKKKAEGEGEGDSESGSASSDEEEEE
jgi:small subunit ribosomal protein S6